MTSSLLSRPVAAVLLALPAVPLPAQEAAPEELLRRSLAEEGVSLDLEGGFVSFPVRVLVREDLLEYLLVGPNGQVHESLFLSEVRPSLVNTALLALGLEPGRNARWVPVEPPAAPDGEEGPAATHEVLAPEGDGLCLHVGWREGEETYFFRVDDLITNLATGRSMRRHRWVYLGSRFKALRLGDPEVFVADFEGNLINLSFFFQGNTLLTAALPECVEQTIWVANSWLLPPRETVVELVLAREPLTRPPAALVARLPDLGPRRDPAEGDAR